MGRPSGGHRSDHGRRPLLYGQIMDPHWLARFRLCDPSRIGRRQRIAGAPSTVARFRQRGLYRCHEFDLRQPVRLLEAPGLTIHWRRQRSHPMRYLNWQDCLKEKPFARIIDVRSPAEYAENHIPGAVNLPVLSNDERAEVGRLYTQVSRFDARRLGAAMVARSMAGHLETFFAPHPEHARFLLYCWRGGQRSRAAATIVDAVGWDVTVIAGGYKNYRTHVRDSLVRLGPQLRCHILTGLTGSGKSRLLRHMAVEGHQVLDLEALGCHRGSLLGEDPDTPQPSQKHFESLLLQEIERFDLTKPVWVESESKRLGRLWLPEPLWQAMLRATVHEIHVPAAARAGY